MSIKNFIHFEQLFYDLLRFLDKIGKIVKN